MGFLGLTTEARAVAAEAQVRILELQLHQEQLRTAALETALQGMTDRAIKLAERAQPDPHWEPTPAAPPDLPEKVRDAIDQRAEPNSYDWWAMRELAHEKLAAGRKEEEVAQLILDGDDLPTLEEAL